MNIIITLSFTLFLSTAYGQTQDYHVLLDSAKTLFKGEKDLIQAELDKFDYSQVVSLLEKVIELNPNSAEARYFLGYTYSRINSRDGRSMIGMNLELVLKASEQFERVNKLTPKYTDEIIVLDPYSKLSAEWGSMAMSYFHNNKMDSAKWAFHEGKIRGGFGDYILELNRNVLNSCSQNSILISSGDNFTIPLWYLQIVEGLRKDVSVIDISLLNTTWYPRYLSTNNVISFDLSNEVIDTIEYCEWVDSTITIDNFSWTVKPSYGDKYLLRGDRVFLSLLNQNKFQRDLYFTIAFMEESRLSLTDYLYPLQSVDKLVTYTGAEQNHDDYKKTISTLLSLSKYLNMNSPDEHGIFDGFRYNLFKRVTDCIENDKKKDAKELMKLLDKYANETQFPYKDERGKKYAEYLRQSLQK